MYAYLSPVGPDLWDVTLPALFSSTVRVDISMGEPTRVIEAGGREPFQPEGDLNRAAQVPSKIVH